jgi:hypothetical protein
LELTVVAVVATILTAAAVYNLSAHKKMYAPDIQANQMLDFFRAASLEALAKRRTFQVQIDYTDYKLILIDENGPGAGDNREVRSLYLGSKSDVMSGANRPEDVEPEGLPGYQNITEEDDNDGHCSNSGSGGNSGHGGGHGGGCTVVSGHRVVKFRFQSNGTMQNSGGNVSSGTVYIWSPKSAEEISRPSDPHLVRAITLFGPGNAIRLWQYNGSQFIPR